MDLGLERAGWQCKWAVEINEDARKVYKTHWTDVPLYRDVRTFLTGYWHPSSFTVDAVVGGFPCIDISSNGKRAGLAGDQSGLWSEMLRIVRLVRPRYVIVENVADLLARGRGMGTVLGELSESGFDAEWDVVPACAFGLPQRRERVFIVAYARGVRCSIERELRIFRQERSFADAMAQGEHRSSLAAEWIGRMDDGLPPGMDTRRQRKETLAPNGGRRGA
jgi:DNA (cytosine-5)-methyltransferase 1